MTEHTQVNESHKLSTFKYSERAMYHVYLTESYQDLPRNFL